MALLKRAIPRRNGVLIRSTMVGIVPEQVLLVSVLVRRFFFLGIFPESLSNHGHLNDSQVLKLMPTDAQQKILSIVREHLHALQDYLQP